MRTHLAVVLLRRGLKSHVKAKMPRSAEGFCALVYLLQMAAERFFTVVNAAKDLVIPELVLWFRHDSALPVCCKELIVDGIFIGALPNLLAIFIGKLDNLLGKHSVIFNTQGAYDCGDKVRVIQRFRRIDGYIPIRYRADGFYSRQLQDENDGNKLIKHRFHILLWNPFHRGFKRFYGTDPPLVTIEGTEHIIVKVFIRNSQDFKQKCGGIATFIQPHQRDDLF